MVAIPDRPPTADHAPVSVRFTDYGSPADVCGFCSIPDAGHWVPVTHCPESAARLVDGDPLYGIRMAIDARRADEGMSPTLSDVQKYGAVVEQWTCGCPGKHTPYCLKYEPVELTVIQAPAIKEHHCGPHCRPH